MIIKRLIDRTYLRSLVYYISVGYARSGQPCVMTLIEPWYKREISEMQICL